MSTLYLITGPTGVGKSTITKELANTKQKSAIIEGDEIYHQVVGGYVSPWLEGNHLDIFWQICLSNIQIYLENGYDVVFNYILSLDTLNLLKDKLSKYNLNLIVLMVDEDTILKKDKLRPDDCQMGERCLILLNDFKNEGFNDKNILDTSNLTIADTLKYIEDNIDDFKI